MAIAAVANVIGQNNLHGVTTSAIDTTGASLLVLVLESYAPATEPTVSDSKGNTWTQRTAYANAVVRTRIYYAENPTVGSGHTFTASGTGSYPAIAVSAWSGTATATVYDQENGVTTGAAPGSVTPSEDNELLVSGIGNDTPGAPTSPSVDSSFTIIGSATNVTGNSFGVIHAYQIQTTATARNPTFSWSGGGTGSCAIATFKQAAAPATARTLTLLGVGM